MIAHELEMSLHAAFVEARHKRHEFITVEHLLLALLDNPSAQEVLKACSAKVEDLRKSLTELRAAYADCCRCRRGQHPANAGVSTGDSARHIARTVIW